MKNENLKYGVGGIVLGGFIVWLATSTAVNSNNASMMNMMGVRSNATISSRVDSDVIDAHFIEQMIPHHEDAITMAKMALEKSTNENVITLSNNIISSQTKENEKMKEWYKTWFKRELPQGEDVMQHHGMMSKNSSMHMGIMGDDNDMENLANATDFDNTFVKLMIPHHQMAVMMASMLKNGTTKPEMRQLAEDIIKAQTTEIDQMRGWLSEWSK